MFLNPAIYQPEFHQHQHRPMNRISHFLVPFYQGNSTVLIFFYLLLLKINEYVDRIFLSGLKKSLSTLIYSVCNQQRETIKFLFTEEIKMKGNLLFYALTLKEKILFSHVIRIFRRLRQTSWDSTKHITTWYYDKLRFFFFLNHRSDVLHSKFIIKHPFF